MNQEVINWLMVSSMIFFNIFCLIGIIAGIVFIAATNKVRGKVVETMDIAQETTLKVGDAVEESIPSALMELFSFLSGLFFMRRKSTGLRKMLKNLRR